MESLEFYGKDFRPKLVNKSGEELSVIQPELKFRKINQDAVCMMVWCTCHIVYSGKIC